MAIKAPSHFSEMVNGHFKVGLILGFLRGSEEKFKAQTIKITKRVGGGGRGCRFSVNHKFLDLYFVL